MSTRWASPPIGGTTKGGIAGISRGNCRLFITNRSFRESHGNIGPILFWLNLGSKAEVDELVAQWKVADAKIVSEPEDKPWKLREFMAADLDGNLICVFYDFRRDLKHDTSREVGQRLVNARTMVSVTVDPTEVGLSTPPLSSRENESEQDSHDGQRHQNAGSNFHHITPSTPAMFAAQSP